MLSSDSQKRTDRLRKGMPSNEDLRLFPSADRVFYEKAPLAEVVVQLKFPPILAIQVDPPAAFQELVRGAFPLLEEASSLAQMPIPVELRQLIVAQSGGTTFQFLTEDRKNIITLAKDSLTYSTTKYSMWEDFKKQCFVALDALEEIYRPSFYNRIGLRYIDAIDRAAVNKGGVSWSKLLKPHILGELACPNVESNIELAARQIRVGLPSGQGSLLLQHGFSGQIGENNRKYIIDFDFFRETKTEIDNAENILESFHSLAGSAFRWCISDELHNALGPKSM